MHICPVEVAAFFMALPVIRWLVGCCVRCCRHKHTEREQWRTPMMFESPKSAICNAKYHVDVDHDHCQSRPIN
jgi:hypothetical protein